MSQVAGTSVIRMFIYQNFAADEVGSLYNAYDVGLTLHKEHQGERKRPLYASTTVNKIAQSSCALAS